MKKTIIAILITAMTPGVAMAWDQSGGGEIEIGGKITTISYDGNPWEMKLGSAIDMDTKVNGDSKK